MDIKDIGKQIVAQDNRITDCPIFIVERERTEWGYDSDYSEDYKWISHGDDYCEADDDEAERLDALDDMCEDTEGWLKVYYKKYWEFVTACFTEQGCKDYIKLNGHNLGKTRIFACGSFRNNEWRTIRDYLISIRSTKSDTEAL